MKNLTVYTSYLLVIIGFTINCINYGLQTDRMSIGYWTGDDNIFYVGASVIIAGVALFIYIVFKPSNDEFR